MSVRARMTDYARRSADLLGGADGPTARFLLGRRSDDGGFCGRSETSDLYYTAFAVEARAALGGGCAEATCRYVAGFADGAGLDFTHLTCLARARATLGLGGDRDVSSCIAERIDRYRTGDGGYAHLPGAPAGTAYGCFLATAAFQDLGVELREPDGVVRCLKSLARPNGSYANLAAMPIGTTPSTAAAAVTLDQLGWPVSDDALRWLATRRCDDGGLAALPGGRGDLLSTATGLFALATCGGDVLPLASPTRAFVDSLARGGGFGGSSDDAGADCEYTYYAMLSLGVIGEPEKRDERTDR